MHNMSDCWKYDKDSKLKKGFGKDQHCSTALAKKTTSAFAQLSVKVERLKKANKKLKKNSKKRKCEYDSDSSDSDSSWRGGSGSTWGCNCTKFMLTNNTQLDT